MIRVFLDASVLFAAAYSTTGASREIIRQGFRGWTWEREHVGTLARWHVSTLARERVSTLVGWQVGTLDDRRRVGSSLLRHEEEVCGRHWAAGRGEDGGDE